MKILFALTLLLSLSYSAFAEYKTLSDNFVGKGEVENRKLGTYLSLSEHNYDGELNGVYILSNNACTNLNGVGEFAGTLSKNYDLPVCPKNNCKENGEHCLPCAVDWETAQNDPESTARYVLHINVGSECDKPIKQKPPAIQTKGEL